MTCISSLIANSKFDWNFPIFSVELFLNVMTSIPAVFKRPWLSVLKCLDSRMSYFSTHYEMLPVYKEICFWWGSLSVPVTEKLIVAEKYSSIELLMNVGKSFLRTTFPKLKILNLILMYCLKLNFVFQDRSFL